jgi:GDP-L-fucose synthase
MVGSAIWRLLQAEGFTNLHGRTSDELDLRDRDSAFAYLDEIRPRYCVLAAARVGGIMANANQPVEFLSDNLRIQVNVMDAARAVGVERLLFLGSSCIYPRNAPQPIKEEYLLTGPLEPTNDAYAIAKIAGIHQVQAVRREYGLPWISAMPTNLYGPGDNFSAEVAHVIPALLSRFHSAKASGAPEVVLWGSGSPLREFLYVDDLARALVTILERYDGSLPINVGSGEEIRIAKLASAVSQVVGYTGTITWDKSKPDGVPRKLLDSRRLLHLGWRASVDLLGGLCDTYSWFLQTDLLRT